MYFYKTYALYTEKKEFNVLKGRIGDFTKLTVKYIVDGSEVATTPNKEGHIFSKITCSGVKNYSWNIEQWKVNYNKSDITNKDILCSATFIKKFSYSIINLSKTDSSIVKIEHEKTNQTPVLTDYRYVGKNPNNYVCFGSENTSCPEVNLYRIIGTIPTQSEKNGAYENRVKLIKSSAYEEGTSGYLQSSKFSHTGKGYQWNTSLNDNWEVSTANTKVLNKVYWESLGNYQKYIAPSIWYLGAITPEHTTLKIKDFYKYERGSIQSKSNGPLYWRGNIGLLYPSDFAYTMKINSEEVLYNHKEEYKNNSWLYNLEGKYNNCEWSISSKNDSTKDLFLIWSVFSNGSIGGVSGYYFEHFFEIRPTFYLKENVFIKSGNGSKENPYRIDSKE